MKIESLESLEQLLRRVTYQSPLVKFFKKREGPMIIDKPFTLFPEDRPRDFVLRIRTTRARLEEGTRPELERLSQALRRDCKDRPEVESLVAAWKSQIKWTPLVHREPWKAPWFVSPVSSAEWESFRELQERSFARWEDWLCRLSVPLFTAGIPAPGQSFEELDEDQILADARAGVDRVAREGPAGAVPWTTRVYPADHRECFELQRLNWVLEAERRHRPEQGLIDAWRSQIRWAPIKCRRSGLGVYDAIEDLRETFEVEAEEVFDRIEIHASDSVRITNVELKDEGGRTVMMFHSQNEGSWWECPLCGRTFDKREPHENLYGLACIGGGP